MQKKLKSIFSIRTTNSSPEVYEIWKKIKKTKNDMTTYTVVAHIKNSKELIILDKALSNTEIDYIKSQFCK